MGLIGTFLNWVISQINKYSPSLPEFLPFKWVGIMKYKDQKKRVRFGIKHDTEWDKHFLVSWQKKGYWYYRMGTKGRGNVQIMDLLIEWRVS